MCASEAPLAGALEATADATAAADSAPIIDLGFIMVEDDWIFAVVVWFFSSPSRDWVITRHAAKLQPDTAAHRTARVILSMSSRGRAFEEAFGLSS